MVLRWSIVIGVLLLVGRIGMSAESAAGKVLQVVHDFEDVAVGQRRPAIVYWNWTPEQKAAADSYSSSEVVTGSAFGEKCLKFGISDTLPPRDPGYRMYSMSVDYLPPETDAIRMQVKVLAGRFTLSVGGPTVYFGHSDVWAGPIVVDAATHGEWTTIEFDLQQSLTRNFRRSQWAHHAPIIYYTRWVQEPVGIDIAKGSFGEILIDQIELIAYGKGRPFPTFAPEQIKPVGPAIDFADPKSTDALFTIFTSVTDLADFSKPPYAIRRDWIPPQLSRVADGDAGKEVLEITQRGVEEACFAGMKLAGSADANAIALTIKAQHANRSDVVLDFAAYAAPAGQQEAFPWDELRPPLTWRESPAAFTYYISPRLEAVKPASFALYHIRRTIPRDQWTTLVLPLADFVCYYGQGAKQGAFADQQPLTGGDVFALTMLSYYGQRSAPTRILVGDVRLVTVPGSPEEHRSYYQRPRR